MQFFWDSLCEPYFFSEAADVILNDGDPTIQDTNVWCIGNAMGRSLHNNFWAGKEGQFGWWLKSVRFWEQRWFSWTLSFLPKYLWPGLFLGQKFGIQSPMKGMIEKSRSPKKPMNHWMNHESYDEMLIPVAFHLFTDEVLLHRCTGWRDARGR